MLELFAATWMAMAGAGGGDAGGAGGRIVITDDYPKALAVAGERRMPIFIDAWAPW